ncbi:MAG TPA: sporulation integral membrane protein YtvI [Clostridiales bacterium]|nr:sporulation integral membrane protein YtvI [Clostridiales bacterium]
MQKDRLILYLKIVINFILITLLTLFLILALPRLLSFFFPFIIGWIVSLLANPLVHFLEKKIKMRRKHGSAIIIVAAIVFIIGTSALLIAALVREATELSNELPAIIDSMKLQLNEINRYIHRFTSALPKSVQDVMNNLVSDLGKSVTTYMNDRQETSIDSAKSIVGSIAEGFLMIIITILSAYFFTAEKNVLSAGLRKRLPESAINYWGLIYENFASAFGGYFKAQFKIMLILTVIMFIGFEILRINYSFLAALGIALLDVLPVFGTGAILWPWAIYDVLSGQYVRAIGLVVIYLICQVVKQLLQPKMVGDSIGLNPLATLLFMFIGYRFYGVFGMIIGIPVGMVLVNMYRVGMFERLVRGFKIIAKDINEFRKF